MYISINKASIEDFHHLTSIYKREGVLTEKIVEHVKYDFDHIDIDRTIWLVQVDQLVVGSIQLIWDLSQKDLADGKNWAYLHHFRIAKDFWGKGIGSMLYKHIEQEAVKKQLKILTLEVEKTNTNAQGIYRHWGYQYFRESVNPLEIALRKHLTPEVQS